MFVCFVFLSLPNHFPHPNIMFWTSSEMSLGVLLSAGLLPCFHFSFVSSATFVRREIAWSGMAGERGTEEARGLTTTKGHPDGLDGWVGDNDDHTHLVSIVLACRQGKWMV